EPLDEVDLLPLHSAELCKLRAGDRQACARDANQFDQPGHRKARRPPFHPGSNAVYERRSHEKCEFIMIEKLFLRLIHALQFSILPMKTSLWCASARQKRGNGPLFDGSSSTACQRPRGSLA